MLRIAGVFDFIEDAVSSAWDDLKAAPGIGPIATALDDFASGPLKDFAQTTIGKVVLTAVSANAYLLAAPAVGAQLAAVTFALPGVAAGESFAKAWTEAFLERVTALIKYFVGQGIPDDVATSDAGEALSSGMQKVQDFAAQVNVTGMSFQELAQRAGVRADVAALYLAQASGDLSGYLAHVWDPATGADLGLLPTAQSKIQQIMQAGIAAHAAAVAKLAPAATTATTARASAVQGAILHRFLAPSSPAPIVAPAPPSAAVRSSGGVAAVPPRNGAGSTVAIVVLGAAALGALVWWNRSR